MSDLQRARQDDPERSLGSPLLIVGSPRSGTTFLTRMINRFLDIHVARDAGVFLRFHRVLGAYEPMTAAVNMRRLIDHLYRDKIFHVRFLERGLTLSQAELYDALSDYSFPSLVRQVFVETARTHGKAYWGNKKPSYALHLAETEAVFPGAKVVHIVRDGRDVVLSMRRASHMLVEKNWYFAASDWKEHVLLARQAGQQLGPGRYLEIRYETLLAQPIEVFRTLLQFLDTGRDAQAQLENVRAGITAKIRADNHGKWRMQMPPKAVRIVERVAGDLLGELGYDLTFPDVAGRGFNPMHVVLFYIDRAVRNIFMRDSRKLVLAHLNELTSAARVRVGALSRRMPRDVPKPIPGGDLH
jgi:hypothetical protein